MKQLTFEYQMKLSFSQSIKEQQFQLRCLPQDCPHQKVIDLHYSITPIDSIYQFKDGFNNLVISGNAMTKHKEFQFTVKGRINVDYQQHIYEECHPIFHYATQLTTFSPMMKELLPTSHHFEDQMLEIMNNIYQNMHYQQNTTNIYTTASETYQNKVGVCQDYAHIMLAVCRYLHYPARYIAGMLYGEGETHAWIEVYHEGIWYAYDPTHNRKVDEQYIVLSKGRDYNDCIVDKGVFLGYCDQTQNVHVSVK